MPLPSSYPGGECDARCAPTTSCTTTTHRVQAQIVRKAFRGSEFLHTLRLRSGLQVMAHAQPPRPCGRASGLAFCAQVDHVVTLHAAHEATGQFASNRPLAPAEKLAAAIFS